MPWCNYMRVLVMHHSPRANTWASCLKERWRKPPVGGSASLMSANSFLLAPSSLSLRFEWTWWTHYNHPTRTAKQWYKHYCQQASLSGDWHLSQGESNNKAPPIGKASIIQATNPHKSPPKLEGSMTAEVKHLLDQAIIEASSCESEQSSLLQWSLCLHLRNQNLQFH